MQPLILPPLSLYVHMPWCVQKCPYCDFNSHGLRGGQVPEQAYIDGLLADLQAELVFVQGREIQTVFFGGGTPSLFSAAAIERFLNATQQLIPFADNCEITLEANPGTIERGLFAEYAAAGVNRLSIGVQSFNNEQLVKLGRVHNSREAHIAAEEAHAAGLSRFNLDLMYALPQQTLAQALDDVQQAMCLEPAHISHYQLTLEPNTLFYQQRPTLPDSDLAWEMQAECQQLLSGNGYVQYEVSAYALAGQQCQHNINYWQFGDYLAVGAGAHAKVTVLEQQQILRRARKKHPKAWLAGERLESHVEIPLAERPFEFMLNALRLNAGFTWDLFEQRVGLAQSDISEPLLKAVEQGLLEKTATYCRPTALGQRYMNDLLTLFLD